MRRTCIFLSLFLAFAFLHGQEQQELPQEPVHVRVGTRHAPPFSYQNTAGEWQGIAIGLLEELAVTVGFTYELEEFPLMPDLLDAAQAGHIDFAIAAITITPQREAWLDFSHPFYFTGLGLALPDQQAQPLWWLLLISLFSWPFLQVILALAAVLMLTGFLLWLVERRHNPQFPKEVLPGIGSGFWWSAVTMTTVGYGDKAPQTLPGRLIALIWMFAALIMIASFTAQITSVLTLSAFSQRIGGPEGLGRTRVAVVRGTTGETYAEEQGLRTEVYPDLPQALAALEQASVGAVLHDHPLLVHRVREGEAQLSVLDRTFERQDYGIAMMLGSPWRKPLNKALLEAISTEDWRRRLAAYGLR